MLYIENNTIYINRSDDGSLDIALTEDTGESYTMEETDVLTLTVRKSPSKDSPVLIQKESTPGYAAIVIDSEDTEALDVGLYSADIQLTMADGKRITVWPRLSGSQRSRETNFRNFCIMPEVTRS